jgi:hypothetical protein
MRPRTLFAASPRARIERIARWMRRIIPITAIAAMLGTVALWLNPAWILATVPGQIGIPAGSLALSPAAQLGGFLVSALPLAVLVVSLAQTQALFGRFAQGEVFSSGNAGRLRLVALCVVALAVARPLVRALLGVILTAGNPPGQRLLAVTVSSDDVFIGLAGVLLLAVAWVMVEGTRLADENASFV